MNELICILNTYMSISAQRTSGNTPSATFKKKTHTHTRAPEVKESATELLPQFGGAELGFWVGNFKRDSQTPPFFLQNVGNRMVIGGHGGHFR